MSKKQFISNIIDHVKNYNPGLRSDGKILCYIIAMSEKFEEIYGEVQDTDSTVWKIMFITMKDQDGHKIFVKGKKRDVRKMFDYCFE